MECGHTAKKLALIVNSYEVSLSAYQKAMILMPHCAQPLATFHHVPQIRGSHHLLRDHNNKTGQRGTPDARNGEELEETRNVVGLADDAGLNFELAVNIVQVASGLNRVVTKAEERLVCLLVAVLLHVPSWRSDMMC